MGTHAHLLNEVGIFPISTLKFIAKLGIHSSLFVLPWRFLSVEVGFAISLGLPQIHPTVGMVCLMAAVSVAVTKTPVMTSIILGVLSGTTMLAVIAIALF